MTRRVAASSSITKAIRMHAAMQRRCQARLNRNAPRVPPRIGDVYLVNDRRPGGSETKACIDRKHRRVRVRITGADQGRPRPLIEDPLEHRRLEPFTDAAPAVGRYDRRAALPEQVRRQRVVAHLGESRSGAGRIFDRQEQPPQAPGRVPRPIELADQVRGRVPVLHGLSAWGGVHRVVSDDDVAHQLLGDVAVDPHQAVARRIEHRPLVDQPAIDLGDGDLVDVRPEGLVSADPPEERLAGRHAVVRGEFDHDVVGAARGIDDLPEQALRDASATVRRRDVDVRVAQMLVRVGLPARDETPSDELPRRRADNPLPHLQEPRTIAHPKREDLERDRRLLRSALVRDLVLQIVELAKKRVVRAGEIDRFDPVLGPLGYSHLRMMAERRSRGIIRFGTPVAARNPVRMLDESLRAMKLLWKEPRATFKGRFYQLTEAIAEPKPMQRPHPPIWIGAKGQRMLRLTARHGDVWNSNIQGFDETVAASRYLDEACRKIGRDPATVRRSMNVRLDGPDDTLNRAEAAVKAGFSELLVMIGGGGTSATLDPRKRAEAAAGLLPRLRALG